MARIFDEMKMRVGSASLAGLIAVNVGVWLLLRIAGVVFFLATGHSGEFAVCQWVELPALPAHLATHWYGVVTYMFAQYGVLHLLFNMLWLYWFGRMFLDISSDRQLLVLYVYGGLAGALFFLGVYNLLPAFEGSNVWLIGSSASVLAIVTATAILMPDYPVPLLLLGTVKLKWIAIATIIIVLMSVAGSNMGGEIAHVGGIAMGIVYGWLRRFKSRDITLPCVRAMERCSALLDGSRRPQKRKKPRRGRRDSDPDADDRRDLDMILDKIKRSGYGALTAAERKRLFEVSSRLK